MLASRAALIAEIESSASHVVDESHIMSVLNAKATLGPSIFSAPSGRPSSPNDLAAAIRQSSPNLNATMQMPPGSNMRLRMPPPGRYPIAVEGLPVTQPSSIAIRNWNEGQT